MSATTTAKIAAAVAGGYLLGRTKKLKLAITLAGLLAGRRLAADPKALADRIVEENPELGHLRSQLTDGLTKAAKDLAIATAASQMESVTSALQGPAEQAGSATGNGPGQGGGTRKSSGSSTGKSSGSSTRRSTGSSGGRSGPAKKSGTKKTPGKKAAGKKTAAKRSSGSGRSTGSKKPAKASASSGGR